MSRSTSDPGPLAAWPEEPEDGTNGQGNGSSKRGRRSTVAERNTTVMTAKTAPPSLREYGKYKELFYNLTLRDLRSKYKRSVIGWGWSKTPRTRPFSTSAGGRARPATPITTPT